MSIWVLSGGGTRGFRDRILLGAKETSEGCLGRMTRMCVSRLKRTLLRHMVSTCVSVCLLGWCFETAIALDAASLFRLTKRSVVLVMNFDQNSQPLAIGSGFFVGDGKAVVTNLHVIQGCSSVRLKLMTGKVVSIETVRGLDVDHDLVLLSVPFADKPLTLSERTPEIGERIIAVGNPKGLEGTLSTGIVSGIRKEGGSTYYQVTAPISPGSSGGPILDERGEVLGVSTFYLAGGQNLNFAMPAMYVRRLLSSAKEMPLSQVSGKKTTLVRRSADERVRVVEPYIDGTRSIVQASVLNNTENPIRNVRLVVVFYSGSTPVHFKLVKVPDVIPPGLGVRFERRDEALIFHGPGEAIMGMGVWRLKFRVLDYDIVERREAPSIPTFD